MLSAWGQQTHLKVVLIDNQTAEVRDWFEFENNFGTDGFVGTVAQGIGHEKKSNFRLAQQEFFRDYSLEDLRTM